MNIEQACGRHHDRLMAVHGVTGLGIGDKDGQPAIVITVATMPAWTLNNARSLPPDRGLGRGAELGKERKDR